MEEIWPNFGADRTFAETEDDVRPAFALMRQPSNYVYPELVRATYILAWRAMNVRLIRSGDAVGRLVQSGMPEVTWRTVENWVRDQPDLPETLLADGLCTVQGFPTWLRRHIHIDAAEAQMAQSETESAGNWRLVRNHRLEAEVARLLQETGIVTPRREKIDWGRLIGVAFVGWIGYQALKANSSGTGSP